MSDRELPPDEPCYVISVAAKLVDLHPQTLRYYDKIGLIQPERTKGRMRLYSQRDIQRLRRIARLTDDLGVNLAGVEVILNMTHRIRELRRELERTRREAEAEIQLLRRVVKDLERRVGEKTESGPIINVTPTQIMGDAEEDS